MEGFKWTEWNNRSVFLILVLHFTATEGRAPHLTVRVGGEVTLPCENRPQTKDQLQCDGTTWLFSHGSRSPALELINLGQVREDKTKSDRLSVTEDCSLVVKELRVSDSGQYSCRQFDKSSPAPVSTVVVYLSLINIHEDRHAMTVTCSVLSHERCGHTVEWLNEGVRDDRQSSYTSCSTTLTFKTPPGPKDEASLRCKVTDSDGGNQLLCSVSSQSSCEKMGTSDSVDSNKQDDGCQGANEKCPSKPWYFPHWWWFIIVAVALAALLIIVVALVRRRRTRGNKTRTDDDAKPSSAPAVTQAPETSEATADPEDVVSYASVSYIKKTVSKARVQVDDEVTYSALNVRPGATEDPSSFYASVNKPTEKTGHNKVTSNINTLVNDSDDK